MSQVIIIIANTYIWCYVAGVLQSALFILIHLNFTTTLSSIIISPIEN